MMSLFLNSIGVALGASFLALLGGFACALFALSAPRRARLGLMIGAAATLALPPFLVANCWLELTANWRARLGPETSAHWMLPVAAGVLGGMYWPISFFLILGRWQLVQREFLEMEPGLRGGRLVRHWLLPLARPALVQAFLLTTSLALSNFTVPTLFQIRVFTEAFWIRFNTGGDPWSAIRETWPMFLLPAILLPWLRPAQFSWPRRDSNLPSPLIRSRLGFWHLISLTASIVLLGSVLFLPLWMLTSNPRTWSELPGAFSANAPALGMTLLTCLGAALLSSTLGLGLCRRPHDIPSGRWFPWLWLPFLLPGIATGLFLIWTCNRPALSAVYQSPFILTLAFTLRYAGPASTALLIAHRSVDRSSIEQSRMDGSSLFQRLRHVYWPQLGPPLAASAYVGFLLCLWDVESAVLIQPPGGQTLALRIFNFLHYGHSTQVNALCLLILTVAVVPLIAGSWLFRPGNSVHSSGRDAT